MNKKEEKEKFFELADLISEGGKLISEIIFSPEINMEKIMLVLDLEEKGDRVRDELNRHFATQQSVPYLALDRAKLLRRIDDILDEFARTARTVKEYNESLPRNFTADIKFVSDAIKTSSQNLGEAIKIVYTSFDDAWKLVRGIEELRDNVVEKGMEVEAGYFKTSNDWKEFEALSRMHKRAQVIMALIKAAGEILELMSIKYVG